MASEKLYTLVCRDCGREMLSKSPNKEYCEDCIKQRRIAQSARNWQKTKAREQMRKSEEKRTQNHTANAKQTQQDMIPAEYLFRCEMTLMSRAGIQYGALSRWKQLHVGEYMDWVDEVRKLYKTKADAGYQVCIPEELPVSLRNRMPPQEHIWGNVGGRVGK